MNANGLIVYGGMAWGCYSTDSAIPGNARHFWKGGRARNDDPSIRDCIEF